ncbi:glycylpeptide N-tetradecanoyltransferase [Trichomonascus vanleenenianus]|uniref:glycylpeptide N-tetradecanoyltransferase NMT1 n=1 Tax=Trichomonascus vanleenenianus TaxID=2268995 RepID=UPI003ECA0025
MPEDKNAEKPVHTAGMRIEDLLKMLSMPQEKPQKSMEEYKFWKTQPVPHLGTEVDTEGPIEHKALADVPKSPQNLPGDFEWSTVDITQDAQLQEVYDLLYHNYIEDDDESFRFKYSVEFLQWALMPPAWQPEWHVGVRVKSTNKLIGFISGIPATLKVREGEPLKVAEINFLCVHKKLRSKRLAPVLIREVTRRVNLTGVWQALYTAGTLLPTPISTSRYYHRSINWPKLHAVGFSPLPIGSTPAKQVAKYALPAEKTLPGFRKMTEEDLPAVHKLLTEYLKRFEIIPVMDEEELKHGLLGAPDVVYPYVVEEDGKVTDVVSFYGLESSVLGNDQYDSIKVAYSFYYASSAGIGDKVDQKKLKSRLVNLFNNALIAAKGLDYDVFNALTLQDNPLFLEDLKFGCGDGFLNYYLFNYRAFPIHGGIDQKDNSLVYQPNKGVGVVML